MAWGKSAGAGIDDLAGKLRCNDERLRSLTILRFRRLNDQDVNLLSEALEQNNVLQELICSSHPMSQEAAARLGAALEKNTTLQRISIGDSTFGDQALARMIEAGLHANRSLMTWDLEHKGLTQASACSLSRVLARHHCLQHVILSRNALTDQGLQQLCSATWAPDISRLELAQCDIGPQGLAALAHAPSLQQLRQLDLSHNKLGSEAAGALRHMLEAAHMLEQLQLHNTAVGDAGIAAVGMALPQATNLRQLDVSSTGITSTGLSELAAALARRKGDTADAAQAASTQLQQLVLAGNPGISDAAVADLAKIWAHLGNTQVGGSAAAAAAALPGLSLDLAMSAVGSEGIQGLAQVPLLQRLSLFGCKIGQSGFCALLKCLNNGGFRALRELNLTGCSLQLEELQNLLQSITESTNVLPDLHTLELAANEGVQEPVFEELVAQLRAARPGLDVHFRMADAGDQQCPS